MTCEKECLNHPAVIVLINFFREMHAWERGLISARREGWKSDEEHAAFFSRESENRKKIYARYCESGEKSKRLKGGGFSFLTDDTEHDPKREVIESVEIKPTKVTVSTRQLQGYRFKVRYEIVLKSGEWRIRDKTQYCFEKSETWNSSSL